MLKQNDVLITQNPLRFFGGAAAGQTSSSRNNFNHPSVSLNRNFSGDGFDPTSALPVGYSGIYAEIQSMKPSGLASSTGINGVSNVTANAIMLGPISSISNGVSNISTSYLYGHTTGSISSNINVGAALNANTVAGAVLGSTVEGPYSMVNVLRIVAAVVGGQVSGGPNNPSFRDLSNTHSVVTGVVDAQGNRSSVTINAN